jgi:two-component sensor histidine kinase
MESGKARSGEVRINSGLARWYELYLEPSRNETGQVTGLAGAVVEVTERKQDEAHLRLLTRELSHRSKNLLAVIQAMARQTARRAGSIDAFLNQFAARLQALAASHDLLVRENWYGVPFSELVQSQLGAFLEGPQVVAEGPQVVLSPEAAQHLGLALHELASNAAKYGALSVPHGIVDICWGRVPASAGGGLEVVWNEQGGPSVTMPKQRGFGSAVIEQNLIRSLDAKVELSFLPAGVRCRVVIPGNHISVGRGPVT